MNRLRRRILLSLGLLLAVLAALVLVAGLWFRHRLTASLPQLDGERRVAGLSAPVEVERDDLGVPTIRAASRLDGVRALGFLHAQDRFFQMDLLRRQAAGELAELVGPAVVKVDRDHRVHRFRDVARRIVAAAKSEDRALLSAYAEGVNTGLAALGDKPFEYLALGVKPAPWRPEDTILAVHAMFFELNDSTGSRESNLGLLHDRLPAPLFAFLAPVGTEWDAPLLGEAFATAPIPGPEVFDLRTRPALPQAASLRPAPLPEEVSAAGSNNFAVAGAHTADGRALLANDMHLGIRVPNTWYRVAIVHPDGRGGTVRMTGVTLPGTPLVSVGSNGHVAWGYTNSYGDWTDLVVLETDPADPEVYRMPQGPKRFETVREVIKVKGRPDETLEVKETVWGPVIDHDHLGRPRALAWTAQHPEAVNLELEGLETARTLEEAMAVANRAGIPPQNFTVADETGRIGWTIIGQIPRRVGFDGRLPTSWADGSRRWDGWLTPEEHPRVVDPPSGRIWTANARTMDGDALARLGDGGYMLGARARQIRDDLLTLEKASPRDLLAIQLDDQARFLARWRDLLLRTLTPAATQGNARRAELRRLMATTWTGRASVNSVAYRMTREFRKRLLDRVFQSITGIAGRSELEHFGGFGRPTQQFEGPLWRLVTERPAHLLDPRFQSWDGELLAAVDDLIADSVQESGPDLARRTWGERNTTHIQHPLSLGVPLLARWLDVPARQLPGDEDMPRVQGRATGASERLVVSPGHEETGLFHMPVGQSGHPLSPYYQKGHADWEEGRATPFLPGKAVHRLTLRP
ncbi:MAG TPA: penicillin acylase family protein [Thermoanaerobaculia bacterium]|jgi:penicillin amidase|nr:penicillin acylase family protein [Thermoanaerobaculia bacterium]